MSRSVIAGLAAAAAVGTMALAACGPSGTSGGATRSATPPAGASASPAPASASPSPTSAAAGACPTSSLTVSVDTKRGGAAAGSAYYPIEFQNTSSSSCTLSGYPGVSFVTHQGGSIIGSPASRNSSANAVQVTVPAGGFAHAILQVVDAGNYSASACHPVTAHLLQVYPPGQTAAGYASFSTQACSAKLPASLGSPLSVYPVRAGKGQMGQAP